ncbi:MAG: stage V sporulation protein D, partial [Candidatus Gallimonas sp.]
MAIAFIFCVFLGRFFYIQVIWEDELHYLALDQWTREIPVVAARGKIFDTNGELLAGNKTAYSVYARANAVTDAEKSATVLSGALGLSYEEVLRKLTDKSKSEVAVVRRTDKSVVEKIEGSDLDGVYYAGDNVRLYPYGPLACQVIGFTSYDTSGSTGVEQY